MWADTLDRAHDAGTRDERQAGVVHERTAVVEAAGAPRREREGHRLREHDHDDEELYQADQSRLGAGQCQQRDEQHGREAIERGASPSQHQRGSANLAGPQGDGHEQQPGECRRRATNRHEEVGPARIHQTCTPLTPTLRRRRVRPTHDRGKLCVSAVASGGVLSCRIVGALVGGGDDEFIFVSHLVVRGSNEEIGRALAEAARQAGAPLVPVVDRDTQPCATPVVPTQLAAALCTHGRHRSRLRVRCG